MRWLLEFETTTWPACANARSISVATEASMAENSSRGALPGLHSSTVRSGHRVRRAAGQVPGHGVADTSCRPSGRSRPATSGRTTGGPARNLTKCWPTMPVAPRMPTSIRVCISVFTILLIDFDCFQKLPSSARALPACAPREWFPARSGTARPIARRMPEYRWCRPPRWSPCPSSEFSRSAGISMHLAQLGAARPPPRASAVLVAAESPTSRIMISACASSAITLGARPPEMRADVQRARPQQLIHRQRNAPHVGQRVEQLVDGRIAQLRIGRMRHLARWPPPHSAARPSSPAPAGSPWARR